MYYVYMLRCRGGVYYTGLAVDVARRFQTHLSGKGAKFTRAYPPEEIAAASCSFCWWVRRFLMAYSTRAAVPLSPQRHTAAISSGG